MVSHHLSACHSKSRRGIIAERMNEKLGWVRRCRRDLASWNRCQTVLQLSLKFINTMGLHSGSADQLRQLLDQQFRAWSEVCETSQKLAATLVEFVREQASRLEEGERTWLSTENLESCFGAFKRLEGQHSKGGFTSLIAALPLLLSEVTPELVRESLKVVSVADQKAWVNKNLGKTLSSQRTQAYQESRTAKTE